MKKLTLLFVLGLLLPPFAVIAQIPGEGFDVTHYEIHVNELNFNDQTMQAETFVSITATAEVQQIVLELKSLEISTITATGCTVADFAQNDDILTIDLASPIVAGSSAVLDIVYGGNTFNETWGGVHWWGTYAYNLGVGFESQPHNLGKAWFPCVDNFTDKATYDVYVSATNDKKVICGGNFMETVDNGDGTTTWYWSTPQEIATYHISMAVGDYEVWEDVYHGIEKDIPVEVYAKPNQMNSVPGTFVHIKEITAFFEEVLGAYPFNRIGYVSTGQGCMEHTDNIAFASSIIDGTTMGEEYVAHELSHMWSGNLVTCRTAGDMWLNEGFASFWGEFYRVGVYGEENFQNSMSTMVNSINSWCNYPNNWMPLNNMPLNMTYDGSAVYDRGAVIVNTMMNYMGRENFLSALRSFFNQYAYQDASSEDLRDALTQYSGINMDGFFDTYVFSSGMPHLYATISSITPVGNQFEVQLNLSYQHIGDSHIGQDNRYEVTFIGPDYQLVTEKVSWNGLHGDATVLLDFEPLGMVNDFKNNWLDGRTQNNLMLKSTSSQNFAYVTAQAETLTDSVLLSIENHLVGPYDDPLIPALNLSTKHFWTINRYDFGEAKVGCMFDYSRANDGDIIQSQNDSATLVYRKNASEPWREIAYTLYPGSIWRQGRFIIDDVQAGEYAIAAWDKEYLDQQELTEPKKVMELFPNPASEQLNVKWNVVSDGQILISDGNGKILKQQGFLRSDGMTVSIEGLPKGWYSVARTDKNGTVIETQVLIIK